MNFINPTVLIGLLAASIPIILHLINLRKLKTVEFSTLQFLKEMQKNKIKKIKLKQLILLILRTLLIIFIVLAFARPAINSTIPGFESFAKTSTIIILDNSFSLDLSDNNGNRFNQAKKTVREIISIMKEGDEAVIIEMANPVSNKQHAFSRNIDYLEAQLDNIKIANTPGDLNKSIVSAGKLLEKATNFSKEIYIISDAQPNIFTQSETEKINASHTNIYFLPIGYTQKSEIKNYSIDSLNILTRIFQVNKPVEIEANVRNNSNSSINSLLTTLSFNENRVAQRTVNLDKKQTRKITIAASPNSSGVFQATTEIENDIFEHDNKKYFGFIIPEKPKVAIFGKQNQRSFINLAAEAAAISDDKEFAKITNYPTSSISNIDLSQFDLIILEDGKFTTSDFSRLKQYIVTGGSALVFANAETDLTSFSNAMQDLGFGNLKMQDFSRENPAQFTATDKLHPFFEGVFKIDDNARSVVESPKIYKTLLATSGQSLIEIGGGNFLSENILDDGKIIYCAVPPNVEWSNFPLTGIFPAIVIRSIAYLASRPELSYNFEIGENNQIIIPKKYCSSSNFKIIDPSGNEFLRQVAMLPAGGILQLNDMRQAGVYKIYNSNNMIVALVALNLQASESNFDKIDKKDIKDSLNTRFENNASINFIEETNYIATDIKKIRTGTELWRLCLILALCCAIAELIVQRNFANKEK